MIHFLRVKYFKFLFLFFITLCNSQEIPPIKIFTSEDYKAENQNWAISQDADGFIYVANNKGLLEFNGASWNLYETPNETIMRSVKAIDKKVFTGFYMDFGFWEKDEFGTLIFTSLVEKLQIQMLEDEQVWHILELDGWILFKSLQRIYLYNINTSEINIIESENRIHKISKVEDVIYYQELNNGVFKIENGQPKLVSNSSFVKEKLIVNFFEKDNRLFFLTEEDGFYSIVKGIIQKWNLPDISILEHKKVYSVSKLTDNGFAIGTVSNGLIYIDENGNLMYTISQFSGLSNNTVLSVFEDRDKNIWLGLDNGINYINNTSAFKTFNKKMDFLGTIYTSVVFNDKLYLGTNQGLFYKNLGSNQPFQFIEKTEGQVWNLTIIDAILFCGHDSGTFIIKQNKAKNIFGKSGTWNFTQIDKNTLLLGCYDGLFVLKKESNNWFYGHKITGFDTSSKYVVQLNALEYFINHEYKGVFKLKIDKDFKKVEKVQIEPSLEKGIYSSIIKHNNKILYAKKNGVYVYNNTQQTFLKDSIYSNLFTDDSFISAKLINDTAKNRIWLFAKNSIKYVSPGTLSDRAKINTISLANKIPKAASGYENIIHLNNEEYLIGTSNGYLKVDLDALQKQEKFDVYINNVKSFVTDSPKKNINILSKNSFSAKENNFIFSFSVPIFNTVNTTKYQHQLVGLNKDWSFPQEANSILFENIPYGEYVFKVRAIIGDEVSSNVSEYHFSIQRPWYISIYMIVLYILLALLSFYLVHVFSKIYYAKQRKELLEKAQKEAALKDLESSQQIIKLNNDKLRADIESKNRELANSTMSIIKKNEFLNDIKNELLEGSGKNITKVVKIIDTNLNNTDDWKLFEEAFNNADKKFLDKIKAKHPELTPNDLRLCAYLRLNLTSKEIAPLLNISPRSVEVKRYRLRKKMNLDHNANLTNYILEI